MFEEGSAVLKRNLGYASKSEEFHIVVFTLKKENLLPKKINNLYLYPTNSTTEWLYVWDALRLSKRIIIENKLLSGSVISTQDPFQTGFVGMILSKKFHLPLQIQIHTDFLSSYFFKSFFNKIRVRIASFVIPRADSLRVVSEVIKQSINKKYPKLKISIDVLPIFFDIEKISMNNNFSTLGVEKLEIFSRFKFIIFMASRLTEEKRIDIALQVFREVATKFPQVGLVIAGSGPEENKLKNLTSSLGLAKNVIFVGWQKDLVPFYKVANIFLLTSEFEGHGMTLVEAAMHGCPIVTTSVGIAKMDLFKNGQNSFVCPVGGTDCLSKAIMDLIEHPGIRQEFSERMRGSIIEIVISKEEYTARYIGFLENLIKTNTR